MRQYIALLLASALALTPAAAAGDAPAAPTPGAQATATPAAPADNASAAPTPATPEASAAPTPEEYLAALRECLAARGLAATDAGQGALDIAGYAELSLTERDGDIAQIQVSACGDGSARSGEAISGALTCAVQAYTPVSEGLLRLKLTELMSMTSGQDSVPGLTLALRLTPEGLELTLTPAAADPEPTQAATRRAGSISDLIALCGAQLPAGWLQTSYVNGDPPDVLINIYATSSEPDELWDCARTLMADYFSQVRASDLSCGRLSVVFYSAGMTPLLSLGISRADALAGDAITAAESTEAFRAEIERLARESDALLVKHYDAG